MRGAVALVLGGLMAGCSAAVAPTTPTLTSTDEFAPGQQPYGAQGSITQQEFVYLQWLAWPQAYGDMVGSFGYPAHRTETADYYHLEDSSSWVVVEYSGTQATGYREE